MQCVFGSTLMNKCTALGGRGLPGLPRTEHYQKQAIYDLFHSYWKNSAEFKTLVSLRECDWAEVQDVKNTAT